MVENPREEHDREDPEVRLARLEQSIAALIEMVTQLLVMKGMEAHSMRTEHGEKKVDLEDSKGENSEDSGKNNNFSSSSNVPVKVEAKLEIPMFDGQVSSEVLNRWLKQIKVYLAFIKSNKHNIFLLLA